MPASEFNVCVVGKDQTKLKEKVRQKLHCQESAEHQKIHMGVADAVDSLVDQMACCKDHALCVEVCGRIGGAEPHHVAVTIKAVHPDCCC